MTRIDRSRARTLLGAILCACAEEEGGDMRQERPGGTWGALAKALQVDARTLQRWVRGEFEPNGHELERLSEYLGQDMGTVLGWARAGQVGHACPKDASH